MKFKKSFLLALVAPLFLFAGAAHAASITTACNNPAGFFPNFSGSVGDIITLTDTVGTCASLATGNSSVATITTNPGWVNSPVTPGNPAVITLSAPGTTTVSWSTTTQGTLSTTVTVTSGSSGTPSLSQWAQILLALLAVGTMAWYYRKQRQTH